MANNLIKSTNGAGCGNARLDNFELMLKFIQEEYNKTSDKLDKLKQANKIKTTTFKQLDLLEYIKTHDNLDRMPKGLHTIVPSSKDCPEGVIFVLRNVNNDVNIDNKNRIHPFYMVYLRNNLEVVCDYLHPKQLLDYLRMLCGGADEPIHNLCDAFNAQTDDGKNMTEYSDLLVVAIESIIDTKNESDIDSLFSPGGTTVNKSKISGLGDFELICFFVVKDECND